MAVHIVEYIEYNKVTFNLFGSEQENKDHGSVIGSMDKIANEIICVHWNSDNLEHLARMGENNVRFKAIEGKIYPKFANNPDKVAMVCCVLQIFYQNGISPSKFAKGVKPMFSDDDWKKVLKKNDGFIRKYEESNHSGPSYINVWEDVVS